MRRFDPQQSGAALLRRGSLPRCTGELQLQPHQLSVGCYVSIGPTTTVNRVSTAAAIPILSSSSSSHLHLALSAVSSFFSSSSPLPLPLLVPLEPLLPPPLSSPFFFLLRRSSFSTRFERPARNFLRAAQNGEKTRKSGIGSSAISAARTFRISEPRRTDGGPRGGGGGASPTSN